MIVMEVAGGPPTSKGTYPPLSVVRGGAAGVGSKLPAQSWRIVARLHGREGKRGEGQHLLRAYTAEEHQHRQREIDVCDITDFMTRTAVAEEAPRGQSTSLRVTGPVFSLRSRRHTHDPPKMLQCQIYGSESLCVHFHLAKLKFSRVQGSNPP